VYGEIRAGSRLHLADLAKDLGVGIGLVREAVTRLASEELVVASPQQGFRVRSISASDLRDLTWIRVELETLALRESIAHGDITWESELVAAHHKLAHTPVWDEGGRYNRGWMEAHRQFHAALASACGSPTLLRMRAELWDAAEIYRHWSGKSRAGGERRPADEHAEILQATLSRDAERATALLTQHLELTSRILVENAEAEASQSRQDGLLSGREPAIAHAPQSSG
jgi:DNA-binding GntR family transcriptional regulator